MITESAQAQVLQVEVVLSPDEYDTYDTELSAVAALLTKVASGIVPVVTDPVYKHGLASDEQLEGTAKTFEKQLLRLSPPRLRRSIKEAGEEYADDMGLTETFLNDQADAPIALSDWVLTVSTRKSFIDALGALDTISVQDRIERMRNLSGWMICILDASDGIFVTKKGTTESMDMLLEGQYGDILDTKMNPSPDESPDISLFDNPKVLKAFLQSEGLIEPAEQNGSNAETQQLKRAYDMAELYELFMTTDQPDNASLHDFEQWIYRSGTLQSRHKEYLLPLQDEMIKALSAPNDYEREKAVQLIRASLTDALLQGLEPHIVSECARVINTHVL